MATHSSAEIIDLTKCDDDMDTGLEVLREPRVRNTPRNPPLSRSRTTTTTTTTNYATIYRVDDPVPSPSGGMGSPTISTVSQSQSQSTRPAQSPLSGALGSLLLGGLGSFGRSISGQHQASGSSQSSASASASVSAQNGLSSSARPDSQQHPSNQRSRMDLRLESLYGHHSPGFQRSPSSHASSPRTFSQAPQSGQASASSPSTRRPAAPGSSDYTRAQTTQSQTAQQAQSSRPNTTHTPTSTAGHPNQASPTMLSQSWAGRTSPAVGTQQSGTARASPQQTASTGRSTYGSNPQAYSRQVSSPVSFMDMHRHIARLDQQWQEQDQQTQRIMMQRVRDEQKRNISLQDQRRLADMQRQSTDESRQKEGQRAHGGQQETQRQQRQEEQQRLQRQQQQQQPQHLAQARAQAQSQAHQAQMQQQQRGSLHHSASTGDLSAYSLGVGSRSAGQHSPQTSSLPHPSSSTPHWSASTLATAGGAPSSLRTSQTHPLPNPTQYRSVGAIGHAWQNAHALQQFNPHRRNPPLVRNSPPSQTLPPVQTKSPPHPYSANPQLRRQLPTGGNQNTTQQSQQPQQTQQTQQAQQAQRLSYQSASSLFSLRKSPPRDISTSQQAQAHPQPHSHPSHSPPLPSTSSNRQGPLPSQASTGAHTESPLLRRNAEPLWSSQFAPTNNRPTPGVGSSASRQQTAASSSAAAGATSRANRQNGIVTSSPVSISSDSSSSRPGSSSAAAATTAPTTNGNMGGNNNPTLNYLRQRFSAQIDPVADHLRPGPGQLLSQPISIPASSANSPIPLSPSPSSTSSFPDPHLRKQDTNTATAHAKPPRDANNSQVNQGNLRGNVTLQNGSLPGGPRTTLQDVTRQDAAFQDTLLQVEARRATEILDSLAPEARNTELRRREALQVQVLQDLALRADAIQADALLAEARRAEAMQIAEADRVDAMDIDAIQAEVLRTDASPNRTVSILTTPSKSSLSDVPPSPSIVRTPKPQQEWTVSKIVTSLETYLDALLVDHGRDVEYAIDMSKPRERTVVSSFDDFADLPVQNIEASDKTTDRVLLRGKLHRDNQRRPETRTIHVKVLPLKSPGEAVPKYRFHHVEIAKNILSPNTPLKFIPHLRDFEDNSEEKRRHDQWIEELESMERKSGFDSTKLFQKGDTTRKSEFTKLLSDYLDHWIARLGIDNCSKATLIRYMANESQNDQSITPQQKNSLLNSCGEDSATPRAAVVASMLTEAFNRVFESRDVTLYDVLKQDEAVENVFDPKKATKSKDQDKEPSLEQIQQYLGTYTSLKCMICNTHSCEHGEFDTENVRRCFSIDDLGGKLWKHVERRRDRQTKELRQQHAHQQKALGATSGNSMHHAANGGAGDFGAGSSKPSAFNSIAAAANSTQCRNKCYRSYDIGDAAFTTREWTENETNLLRSFHLTFANSTGKVPCALCPMMGRHCWEVYRRMKELGLSIALRPETPPEAANAPSVTIKPVNWYDRHRKVLNGDWSDHTYTHMYAIREQREPCNHDGPCTSARGCPCVEAKLLCERFCRCTAECCAFKFTGCACHGSGKTCYQRQKEGKPCICVQLNRECDPVLCGGCGARERADPENRDNDELHATGCQNVSLQRGKSKAVILGQSQLQGCGYGLFTAEDIFADEFIIEYIGELITHDEGVRREARRGDFFDQGANASYLFTLLEQDGIWVDAAIYGNLSRYINHASESDKRGCNITPKILYVNGEFRIRFTAMRDIKAGEELFFNYGENFPNLTKKLLEDKASASDDEATANTTKGRRGGGSSSNNNNSNSRRKSQQSMRSRAPTKSVQSGPSNNGSNGARNGGSNKSNGRNSTSNLQRRSRARAGARKEAPPPRHADFDDQSADDGGDDDDDDDLDHMDIDGGSGVHRMSARSRATKSASLKRKRRAVVDDSDNDNDNNDDGDSDVDGVDRKRKADSDDEHIPEASRRMARSTRRVGASATASIDFAAASIATEDSLPDTPRRLRASRLNAQRASREESGVTKQEADKNDYKVNDHERHPDNPITDEDDHTHGDNQSGVRVSPRTRKRRAALNPGNTNSGSTYTDGDNDTDLQPLRKRPRLSSRRNDAAEAHNQTDSDNNNSMVLDSDESVLPATRSLRQRRARQRQRVTELSAADLSDQRRGVGSDGDGDEGGMSTAASAVVALGTTDDDQSSVFTTSHFSVRAQNHNSATGPTVSSVTTRRRNIVPDSDDDVDLSSRASCGIGRNNSSRPSSSSQPMAPATSAAVLPSVANSSRLSTPLSRPRTPRDGGGGGGGNVGSISRSSSTRRNLRGSDEALAAVHSTPINTRSRSGGEDDSGSSSVDRSQRKRQMPARYRTEDAV